MTQRVKRNLVAATVCVFVVTAVYLNWRYANQLPIDRESEAGKILGQSTLVSGEDQVETPAEDDYFATARLTRQQARDSALAMLREASEEEGEEAAAAASIQVLADYAVAEAQIENLVTAKGYRDCVAFMGEDSISVVVDAGEQGLEPVDVARISEIVLTETDYTAEEIKVLESN